MLRIGIRAWLDPSDAGLRICRYLYQYSGLSYVMEDNVGHWQGNGRESAALQAVECSGKRSNVLSHLN